MSAEERAVDAILARGVHTAADLRRLLGATIADVLAGKITTGQANKASEAVGKLLKGRRRRRDA